MLEKWKFENEREQQEKKKYNRWITHFQCSSVYVCNVVNAGNKANAQANQKALQMHENSHSCQRVILLLRSVKVAFITTPSVSVPFFSPSFVVCVCVYAVVAAAYHFGFAFKHFILTRHCQTSCHQKATNVQMKMKSIWCECVQYGTNAFGVALLPRLLCVDGERVMSSVRRN